MKVVSLYSGAGGLDYGFEAAGFETAFTNDFDHDSCETLRLNRKWPVVERSIFEVPTEEILEIADARGSAEPDADLQILRRLIAQLDELDRALILLYLDGNRYDTIAEILGISETNVGTKIGRIKQRLRRDAATL